VYQVRDPRHRLIAVGPQPETTAPDRRLGIGEPTTKSAGRSSPQRNTTGSPSGPDRQALAPGRRRCCDGRTLIVTEPLRQCRRQRAAGGIGGLRCRDVGNETGCDGVWRVAAITRHADRHHGEHSRGDDDDPRRSAQVGIRTGSATRAPPISYTVASAANYRPEAAGGGGVRDEESETLQQVGEFASSIAGARAAASPLR